MSLALDFQIRAILPLRTVAAFGTARLAGITHAYRNQHDSSVSCSITELLLGVHFIRCRSFNFVIRRPIVIENHWYLPMSLLVSHVSYEKLKIYNTFFTFFRSQAKKKSFSNSSQTATQCRYRNWKCFITTSIIIVFYVLTTQFYLFKYFSSKAQRQQKSGLFCSPMCAGVRVTQQTQKRISRQANKKL